MTRLFVIGPGDRLLVAAQWASLRRGGLVLAPRPEYEAFLIEAPPVRGERLEAELPGRMRSIYPGAAERTALDHRPVPGEPRLRLAFAMDRDVLSVLRAAAGGLPLSASCLLLASARMRGPWIGILWTSVWTDVVCFDGGAVLGTRPLRRDAPQDGGLACAFALSLAEAPPGAPVVVAYSRDAAPELRDLSSALDAVLHGRDFRVVPLEEFIPRPSAGSCAIFRRRDGLAGLDARRAFLFLSLPAAILAASVPVRLSRVREAELSLLKTEYETAKARGYEALERAARADRLTERREELKASLLPDAYRLLADLASGAGEGIRVRSLSLEGVAFRFEAEGPDGLAVLKRMRDSGLFESVELRRSISTPAGGERYTLSGRLRR